jgi:hypothetical protein
LIHACLEGPEAGVYYRGENEIKQGEKSCLVDLPDYVSALATDFSVHITPILDWDDNEVRILNTTRIKNNQFKVIGQPGKFYWSVYGKRNSILVEPYKSQIQVKGEGPYKWH